MELKKTPTVGLALSGAAARSVYYIGFLEVLGENNTPVDYISASSGSCIVAAAYACGTLPELKQQAFTLDKEFLFSIIEKSQDGGGFYQMDKVEEELRKYTKGLTFEETRPLMGFVCTNINTGQEVILSMGDIAKAICASCAIPGIFKPIRWGNWDLADGGLVSILPGKAARDAGADIIVGIHLSPREHVFSNFEIGIKKTLDFLYHAFGFAHARRAYKGLAAILEKSSYYKYFINSEEIEKPATPFPGMFEVLGKAIDISISAQKKSNSREVNFHCDLLIEPDLPFVSVWKRLSYMHFSDLSASKEIYEQGRRDALDFLPQIKKLVSEKAKSM